MSAKTCKHCDTAVDTKIHEEDFGLCDPCRQNYLAHEDEKYWKSLEDSKEG